MSGFYRAMSRCTIKVAMVDCQGVLFQLWRTCNRGQNTSNRIEKSSKVKKDKKYFISTFACYLTAITKFNFW